MKQLGLSEGQHALFTSVHLPAAKFAGLRPLSRAWLDVPQSVRPSLYVVTAFSWTKSSPDDVCYQLGVSPSQSTKFECQ